MCLQFRLETGGQSPPYTAFTASRTPKLTRWHSFEPESASQDAPKVPNEELYFVPGEPKPRQFVADFSLVSGNVKHEPVPKPTSLKMVAEKVGLSSAAVSRVLSGSPAAKSIPKTTQDRILEAARLLNYRPNLLARSLRRGRSHTVGVLLPEVSEGYATLVLAGLEQGLLQAGYFFYLISHHHRADLIEQSQIMLAERAVDGIIAIDTTLQRHRQLPTVTISPSGQARMGHQHRTEP